jgi:TrmH family RNA methyltransferase
VAPAEFAQLAAAAGGQGEVALVLGCEQSGLSNAEIDRCHYLVQIPTNPDYGSLNLAAALQILCYELRIAHLAGQPGQRVPGDVTPATADEMERYFAHLEQTLVQLDFLDPDNPRLLMRRLRRLYNRARPDANEMNILRGILTAVQVHLEPRD